MIKVKPKKWDKAVCLTTGGYLVVYPEKEYTVQGKFYDTEHHHYYFFIDVAGKRAIIEADSVEIIDEEKV